MTIGSENSVELHMDSFQTVSNLNKKCIIKNREFPKKVLSAIICEGIKTPLAGIFP